MTNREFDTLIAEKVMDWKKEKVWIMNAGKEADAWKTEGDPVFCDEWKPTERIEQAWRVVEKLKDERKPGRPDAGFTLDYDDYNKIWRAEFNLSTKYGDTAALAICLAALKAVGIEKV